LSAYPEYKPSGIDWAGSIPEEWDVRRIATLATKITNGFVGPTRDILVNEGVRYLQSLHIKDNKIVFHKEYFVEPEWSTAHSKSILKEGDVVVVQTGDIGQVACVPKEFEDCNCHALIIVSPREGKLCGRFLAQFLNSKVGFDELKRIETGALHPHLNCGLLRDVRFPFPPIGEQVAIADFLDSETAKLDTLLAKKRELIEKLKEKRSALISRTVTRGLPPEAARAGGLNPNPKLKPSGIEWLGEIPEHWEVTRLGYLVSKVGSGKTPKGGAEVYQSDGVMLIRSQNIYDDGFHLEDVAFIDESVDEEMAGTRILAKDVLLNITGASLGRSALVPENFGRANVNQHVCILRPQFSKAMGSFMQRVISSEIVQSQISSFENGSSREGLNFQQVRNLVVALPPLLEQLGISDYLDRETNKIDRMVAKVEEAIERLQEYRTALITAAVTGKIDVRKRSSFR